MQLCGDGAPALPPRVAKTTERYRGHPALAPPPLLRRGPSPTGTQGSQPAHTGSPARALWLVKRLFSQASWSFGNHEPPPAGPGSISASFPQPAERPPAPPRLPSPTASLPCQTPALPAMGCASPLCMVLGPGGSQLLQTTFSG